MKNMQFKKTGATIRKMLREEKYIRQNRKPVNFTMNPLLHEYLRMMARERKESMSEMMNNLIKQAIIMAIFEAEGKPLRGEDWCDDFFDNDLFNFYKLAWEDGFDCGYSQRIKEEEREEE